jgi:sodium transport system ATP-binding protein
VLSEAERLCDEIAIIHRGRIRAEGDLDALVRGTGAADLDEAFFRLVEEAS